MAEKKDDKPEAKGAGGAAGKTGEVDEVKETEKPASQTLGHTHQSKGHKKAFDSEGIVKGGLVKVKAKPGQMQSETLYKVVDISHDKGRLFCSLESFPDPAGGTFGSQFLEDLEVADSDDPGEGPGGHPPPTEEQRKQAEANLAQRRKVDADAQKALDDEAKKLRAEQDRQRHDLRSRRAHGE